MSGNIVVSIIIPVYNKAPYLDTCFSSILNQQLENYELIVVDDGSDDGSSEIIDNFAKKDKRVRVFHTENHGVSYARNLGMTNAYGEYLVFVDADDWIDPDMHRRLVQSIVDSEADIVVCGFTREPQGLERRPSDYGFPIAKTCERHEILFELIFSPFSNSPCNKIYKKEIIQREHLEFPIGVSKGQDKIFNYRYFDSIRTIIFSDSVSYHYRSVVSSSVNRYRPDLFDIEILGFDELETHLDSWGYCNDQQKMRRKRSFETMIVRNIHHLWHDDSAWTRQERLDAMSRIHRVVVTRRYKKYMIGRPLCRSMKNRWLFSLFCNQQFQAIRLLFGLKELVTGGA